MSSQAILHAFRDCFGAVTTVASREAFFIPKGNPMAIFHDVSITLTVEHSKHHHDEYKLTCFYEDASHFFVDHIEIEEAVSYRNGYGIPMELNGDMAAGYTKALLEEERDDIDELCEVEMREPAFMAGGDW